MMSSNTSFFDLPVWCCLKVVGNVAMKRLGGFMGFAPSVCGAHQSGAKTKWWHRISVNLVSIWTAPRWWVWRDKCRHLPWSELHRATVQKNEIWGQICHRRDINLWRCWRRRQGKCLTGILWQPKENKHNRKVSTKAETMVYNLQQPLWLFMGTLPEKKQVQPKVSTPTWTASAGALSCLWVQQ